MTKDTIKFVKKETCTTAIITAVICLVIFLFIEKGGKTAEMIVADLVSGVLPTGAICVILQFFMKKSAVAKGNVPPMGDAGLQVSYAFMPKNSIVFIIAVTLLTGLIFACGFGGAVMVLAPEFTWGKVPYVVFKSIVSGAAAGYAAFHGMVFFSAKIQTASSEAEI